MSNNSRKANFDYLKQGWEVLRNKEQLAEMFHQRNWGSCPPTLDEEPTSYPCLYKEVADWNDRDGGSFRALAYIYDFSPEGAELCEDEGCPQSHIKHVCINDVTKPKEDDAVGMVPMRLMLNVTYDTDTGSETPEQIRQGLEQVVTHFVKSGMLSGHTGASVDTYDVKVELVTPVEPNGLGCEDCDFTGIHSIDRLERHDSCNRFSSDEEAQAFVLRAVRSQMYAQGNRPARTVVCAANRYKTFDGESRGTIIIAGARHHDRIMGSVILNLRDDLIDESVEAEQGFIDQRGVFLTRHEAHAIALENGQRRFRCGGDENQLFSENLY
jgi:hypothetical protein